MKTKACVSRLLLAAVTLFYTALLSGCRQPAPLQTLNADPTPLPADAIGRTTFDPALGIHLDSMVRRPSGLYVQDIVTGNGAVAALGRSIVVRYTGWLPNGKKFDASEITVTLGSGKTIRGWEEGLLGMRVGGRRRLVIPPHLGYGTNSPGEIPANSILVFEMEAMSVF